MLIQEIHQRFKIKYDKIDTAANPELTPEQIDYLLNIAQDTLIELCTVKGLESTQTLTDYLSNLIKRDISIVFYSDGYSEPNARYINLPIDYRKVLMERVQIISPDCNLIKSGKIEANTEYIVVGSITYNGIQRNNEIFTGIITNKKYTGTGKVYKSIRSTATVVPVTRDRYLSSQKNPFRKPSTQEVLRLETKNPSTQGITYELIFSKNVIPLNYRLDYIKEPVQMRYGTAYGTPTTDVQCELNTEAQIKIIELAVQEAEKALKEQGTQVQVQ